jgi:hypothetical protein
MVFALRVQAAFRVAQFGLKMNRLVRYGSITQSRAGLGARRNRIIAYTKIRSAPVFAKASPRQAVADPAYHKQFLKTNGVKI